MSDLQHHTARLNGIDIHYVEAGKGPLMLFVHGFPDFWRVWIDQLAYFARTHRVVALDMRGFNLTSKPKEPEAYRAKHLVEDVRQLILHLRETRCILVAHDWGGAAIWNFAAQHPGMVEKLVIMNSPHTMTFVRELVHNPEQQKASAYMNFFRRPEAEQAMSEDNFRRLFGMFGRGNLRALDAAEKQAYAEAWSTPDGVAGGLNYYRATPMYPPLPDDPGPSALTLDPAQFRVVAPTLVLWGMADTALLPGLLVGLGEHVPNLTVVEMPGVSHWPMREKPDEVNRLIANFIGSP